MQNRLQLAVPRHQFSHVGTRLDRFTWNGEDIVPVRKNFACPHPSVEARNEDDVRMLRCKHGIDIQAYQENVDIPKPVENLEETSFPDWAQQVLRRQRWKEPMPIQMQAWPVALYGYNLIGLAATGSGKTMAYVLPMLVHIIAQPELKPGEGPVGLVLVPTRELCSQVAKTVSLFAQDTKLRCESVYGGEDFANQAEHFLEVVDIVVAVPGRLIALLEERRTNLRRVTFLVLDEADEMLSDGFEHQVKLILSQVRPDRQVLLFSATWQDSLEAFARVATQETMDDQRTIQINVGGSGLAACKDIIQDFWSPGRPTHAPMWSCGDKKSNVLYKALLDIMPLLKEEDKKALVFCNRRDTVDKVVEELKSQNVPCAAFSSLGSQAERDQVLARFKEPCSDLLVLVSTQVLGRGHDFHNVKYVINYDMPERIVEYIHRIGRTGRCGEKGFALTLLEGTDLRFAADLVACLNATSHKVEPWLDVEANRKPQHWKEYYRLRRNGGVEQANEITKWKGRGRGRRHEFLQELQGRGLARGLGLPAAAPTA